MKMATPKVFEKNLYIDRNNEGNPCMSIAALQRELLNSLDLGRVDGVSTRPGLGRKKVVLTLTLAEEA